MDIAYRTVQLVAHIQNSNSGSPSVSLIFLMQLRGLNAAQHTLAAACEARFIHRLQEPEQERGRERGERERERKREQARQREREGERANVSRDGREQLLLQDAAVV